LNCPPLSRSAFQPPPRVRLTPLLRRGSPFFLKLQDFPFFCEFCPPILVIPFAVLTRSDDQTFCIVFFATFFFFFFFSARPFAKPRCIVALLFSSFGATSFFLSSQGPCGKNPPPMTRTLFFFLDFTRQGRTFLDVRVHSLRVYYVPLCSRLAQRDFLSGPPKCTNSPPFLFNRTFFVRP